MSRLGKISSIRAREVLDSRGNPTVEVKAKSGRLEVQASVPSGASTGKHEAHELRDRDPKRFHGKGVLKAVSNVNHVIAPRVEGLECQEQSEIDGLMIELDGTPNKARLGANAILGVSMAVARLGAALNGEGLFEYLSKNGRPRLPIPMMNVINGGEHADNGLAIQEFMIEPVGAEDCSDAVRMGSEVYHSLKEVLKSDYGSGATNVGDEGGFAPPMSRTIEALDTLHKAIEKSGYGEGEVRLGVDAAATTFFAKGKYSIDGKDLNWAQLEDFYASLTDRYGLLTIEDPFGEEEFEAFSSLTARIGRRSKIVGDDLYATNAKRMGIGVKKKSTNAVLIKLNQIGTVTETRGAISKATKSGWAVAVSHRSGETDDSFISHLATGSRSEFIKAGAPARGERVAKYNELLRIEEEAGSKPSYSGSLFR